VSGVLRDGGRRLTARMVGPLHRIGPITMRVRRRNVPRQGGSSGALGRSLRRVGLGLRPRWGLRRVGGSLRRSGGIPCGLVYGRYGDVRSAIEGHAVDRARRLQSRRRTCVSGHARLVAGVRSAEVRAGDRSGRCHAGRSNRAKRKRDRWRRRRVGNGARDTVRADHGDARDRTARSTNSYYFFS